MLEEWKGLCGWAKGWGGGEEKAPAFERWAGLDSGGALQATVNSLEVSEQGP